MFDTHTHSFCSYDSSMKLEEICQAAIAKQLYGVTVTDHANLNQFDEDVLVQCFSERTPAYQLCRDQYCDRLKFLCGIEIGEYLRESEKAKRLLSLQEYDQIIAAIHYLQFNGNDITFAAAVFDHHVTDEEIYQYLSIYFEDLLKTAETFDFDVLAHLTYPLRYINIKYERKIEIGYFEEIICHIFKTIIERNFSLEVNTSHFQDRFQYQLTPDVNLLKRYRSMGGNLVTLGSDAHIPHKIGLGFDAVRKILKDLGFEHCCYYEKRIPTKIVL